MKKIAIKKKTVFLFGNKKNGSPQGVRPTTEGQGDPTWWTVTLTIGGGLK
ncbi:hypothetical protein GCM10023231_36360 [Olivibacter ginsenosidimutans]|uniref:Uncharacterized protein n=1 Tax=Olivibacter ginsenosidimutans TaxID=1176537 RepID=A0ABP9C5W1_9SPHI